MRTALLLVLWIATVGGAYLIGTQRPAEAPLPSDPPLDRGEVADADAAADLVDPGPYLRPAPPLSASRVGESARADAPSGAEASNEYASLTEADLSLEGITDPDELMRRIRARVASLLGKGKEAHLELVRFLDKEVVENDRLEQVFRDDEDAARQIYPWIEFLVHRKDDVVDVLDTVYEAMAENPAYFEDIDDDTLEVFTEGISYVLPGAIDEARLDVFRGHARKILAHDEADLPDAVRKARRDLDRALRVWAPRLGVEEALAQVRSGELKGAEALAVLRRAQPEEVSGIDLAALLVPGIEQGDWQAIQDLATLPLGSREIGALDEALLTGATRGRVHGWHVARYLQGTGRGGWPQAQTLVERGLRLGDRDARGPFAEALGSLKSRPPVDYVRWMLEAHDLPDSIERKVKARFGLE